MQNARVSPARGGNVRRTKGVRGTTDAKQPQSQTKKTTPIIQIISNHAHHGSPPSDPSHPSSKNNLAVKLPFQRQVCSNFFIHLHPRIPRKPTSHIQNRPISAPPPHHITNTVTKHPYSELAGLAASSSTPPAIRGSFTAVSRQFHGSFAAKQRLKNTHHPTHHHAIIPTS